MKPGHWIIVLVAAGLAAGIFTGRKLAAERRQVAEQATEETLQKSKRTDPAGGRLKGERKHDLASVLRIYRRSMGPNSPLSRELERLDPAALRALLDGLLEDLELPFQERQRESWDLLNLAVAEFYRREGEQALEWADGMIGPIRSTLLITVINAAARESPELARSWSERFKPEFGEGWASHHLSAAIQGATARGVEDLMRLKDLYGADVQIYPQGEFAEGFDFKRLVTALPVDSSMGDAVQRWVAADKEAAWNGIRGMDDAKALPAYFSALFLGVSAMEGDEKAAEWIAGKIDQLPEAARKAAFFTLLTTAQGSPSGVAALVEALPRESDRILLAASVMSPHGDNGLGRAALQTLGSPAAQTEALLVVAATYRPGMSYGGKPHYNMVHGYFDSTMEELGLDPEARARIKAALIPPARK